jgi:hypothetical protein
VKPAVAERIAEYWVPALGHHEGRTDRGTHHLAEGICTDNEAYQSLAHRYVVGAGVRDMQKGRKPATLASVLQA